MTPDVKRIISEKLKAAKKAEELTNFEVAKILGLVNPIYVTQIFNEKLWSKAPAKAFEQVRDWTNSGLSLKKYGVWRENKGEKSENLRSEEKFTVKPKPVVEKAIFDLDKKLTNSEKAGMIREEAWGEMAEEKDLEDDNKKMEESLETTERSNGEPQLDAVHYTISVLVKRLDKVEKMNSMQAMAILDLNKKLTNSEAASESESITKAAAESEFITDFISRLNNLGVTGKITFQLELPGKGVLDES